MLSRKTENDLAKMVRTSITHDDVAHSFIHVLEVVRLAKWILKEVDANKRIVVGAAYCHDLRSRGEVGFSNATKRSADAAEGILRQIGYSATEIIEVKNCIVTSSWEYAVGGGAPCSTEAAIVRDADWLDAMGAHGIARVFAFAGRYCVPLKPLKYAPNHPVRLPPKVNQPEPSPFYHFYSKLLWLKDQLLTEPARREGLYRHQFMVSFLSEYCTEKIRKA